MPNAADSAGRSFPMRPPASTPGCDSDSLSGSEVTMKLLRRIRGAIGMGFTWGGAWAVAGMVLAAATGFKADAPFPLIFGVLGFGAGTIFSGLLALTQGRRRFDQMSLRRFAAWGAIGGLTLAAIFAKA